MPKDRASRRNQFNHWDDDELELPRSSGKEGRKTKSALHSNRKDWARSKHGRSDILDVEGDQESWLKPAPVVSTKDLHENEDEFNFDAEVSLSLTEIRELADRIKQIEFTTANLMQSVRSCGIDFGVDMDQQFASLNKRRVEIEEKIQEQVHLYNRESNAFQQSMGENSAQLVAEMIRFESKKQSIYHRLNHYCQKLLMDLQAFHEGVEGLAWNLDQCG